jgi:hypothetical protein
MIGDKGHLGYKTSIVANEIADENYFASKFLELATLSKVPLVDTYLREGIKGIYHNNDITIALEKFARWMEETGRTKVTTIKITVNGVEHESLSTKITYQDICIIANGKVIKGLTCTWSGKGNKGGHLSWNDEGFPLSIKNGTHFNIC